jgi:hypothetical protein
MTAPEHAADVRLSSQRSYPPAPTRSAYPAASTMAATSGVPSISMSVGRDVLPDNEQADEGEHAQHGNERRNPQREVPLRQQALCPQRVDAPLVLDHGHDHLAPRSGPTDWSPNLQRPARSDSDEVLEIYSSRLPLGTGLKNVLEAVKDSAV